MNFTRQKKLHLNGAKHLWKFDQRPKDPDSCERLMAEGEGEIEYDHKGLTATARQDTVWNNWYMLMNFDQQRISCLMLYHTLAG